MCIVFENIKMEQDIIISIYLQSTGFHFLYSNDIFGHNMFRYKYVTYINTHTFKLERLMIEIKQSK